MAYKIALLGNFFSPHVNFKNYRHTITENSSVCIRSGQPATRVPLVACGHCPSGTCSRTDSAVSYLSEASSVVPPVCSLAKRQPALSRRDGHGCCWLLMAAFPLHLMPPCQTPAAQRAPSATWGKPPHPTAWTSLPQKPLLSWG